MPSLSAGAVGDKTSVSSDGLEAAIRHIRQELEYLDTDPGFELLCRMRQVDPEGQKDADYWDIVDGYIEHKCATARNQGAGGPGTDLRELFAALPHYIYTQYMLDNHDHYIEEAEFDRIKSAASRFNGLVRTAAEAWPELQASQLITALLDLVSDTITDKKLRSSADYYIHAIVRGAQHELAFGQMLTRAGYEYRHGSTFQDLHGVDYVILDKQGSPADYIDVKASLAEIRKDKADQQLYRRTHDGHLVMYSLLTDTDLEDSFHLSDDVAAHKAHQLAGLLRDARQHRFRRLRHRGRHLITRVRHGRRKRHSQPSHQL